MSLPSVLSRSVASYRRSGIFICYRREETAANARLLYARLSEYFGKNCVFMDVEAITIGTDFTRAVREAVSRCNVILVLIGRDWSTITDSKGKRRIDNPDDWIRVEIETALQRDITVVPVLIDGAVLPQADDLPSSLQPLIQRQALELRHTQFKSDSQRLMKVIDGILWINPIRSVARSVAVGAIVTVLGRALVRGLSRH